MDTKKFIKNVEESITALTDHLNKLHTERKIDDYKFVFDLVHDVSKTVNMFRSLDIESQEFSAGIKLLDSLMERGCAYLKEQYHE